jgi:bifunctional DNA-binding transcriptional regulator/antitoxin component of YhaV-PrlF toxin-antitoxin module
VTNSDHHSSSPPNSDPGTTFLVQNQTVTKKYRLNIPHHLQEAYDVSTHDVVHAVVELSSEVMLLADTVVKTPGQLTIPARKRHIYNITPGDSVQFEIELTPYTYVPGQADTQPGTNS